MTKICTYLSSSSVMALFTGTPCVGPCLWHHILFSINLWELFSNTACINVRSYLRNCIVLPCFCCRVRDQTSEASYLVPETDRGLQECDDYRLDVFLEKWHRPLRPHPQVQTPADVRNTHQISVAVCSTESFHLKPVYWMHTHFIFIFFKWTLRPFL